MQKIHSKHSELENNYCYMLFSFYHAVKFDHQISNVEPLRFVHLQLLKYSSSRATLLQLFIQYILNAITLIYNIDLKPQPQYCISFLW